MNSASLLMFIICSLMTACLFAMRAMSEEERKNRIKAWVMSALVAVAAIVLMVFTVIDEIMRAFTP